MTHDEKIKEYVQAWTELRGNTPDLSDYADRIDTALNRIQAMQSLLSELHQRKHDKTFDDPHDFAIDCAMSALAEQIIDQKLYVQAFDLASRQPCSNGGDI